MKEHLNITQSQITHKLITNGKIGKLKEQYHNGWTTNSYKWHETQKKVTGVNGIWT